MKNSKLFFVLLVTYIFSCQIAYADLFRVTPEWLKDNLNNQDLVIIDSRDKKDYDIGHIPGAINLPDSLTFQQKSKGGEIVEPDVMQRMLRERGIDHGKSIVVYDGGLLVDASRVFWALEVYGLKDVKILNTGFKYWKNRSYPVTSETTKVKPSKYVASIDHRRIASKFSTQLATANPNHTVLDARPVDNYVGIKSTAKRFGHIPTAVNIPIHDLFVTKDDARTIKDTEELKKLYANLPRNSKIITYCEYGRASSAVYLTLRELGFDVSNYDASWREWANDFSLPIEK